MEKILPEGKLKEMIMLELVAKCQLFKIMKRNQVVSKKCKNLKDVQLMELKDSECS